MLSFLWACYLGLCAVFMVIASGCLGFMCSVVYEPFLCVLWACLRALCLFACFHFRSVFGFEVYVSTVFHRVFGLRVLVSCFCCSH